MKINKFKEFIKESATNNFPSEEEVEDYFLRAVEVYGYSTSFYNKNYLSKNSEIDTKCHNQILLCKVIKNYKLIEEEKIISSELNDTKERIKSKFGLKCSWDLETLETHGYVILGMGENERRIETEPDDITIRIQFEIR